MKYSYYKELSRFFLWFQHKHQLDLNDPNLLDEVWTKREEELYNYNWNTLEVSKDPNAYEYLRNIIEDSRCYRK